MSSEFYVEQLSVDALDQLTRILQQRNISKRSNSSLAAAARKRCKSLAVFVCEAWVHVPELATVPYIHGWHIDLICLHLEAITSGQLRELGHANRLLINVPPGMMKSLLLSVFWPAWEWAYGNAHFQYLATSFRETNCKRDTMRMRELVESEWYKNLFGKNWVDGKGKKAKTHRGVKIVNRGDLYISNTAGGWRHGIPFGSLMGQRGDRLIIDDPHSTDGIESDPDRERVTRRFRERALFSINDPETSAIVIIMQRLHVADLSGVIEGLKLSYQRLVLPMRFESDRRCETAVGRDPRRTEGELLFPKRYNLEYLDTLESGMTSYAVASQHQQLPHLREGSMFKPSWFADRIVPAAPDGTRWVRHWDLAGSKRHGTGTGQAWTAGVKLGKARDGRYYVGHVHRLMDEGDEVRRAIKAWAASDSHSCRISLPQDPGQGAKIQIKDMVRMLDGYSVNILREGALGDKVQRAEPFQSQAAAGNVYLVKGEWNESYLDELFSFPGAPVKDQVDATSGAYATLQKIAIIDWNDRPLGAVQVDGGPRMPGIGLGDIWGTGGGLGVSQGGELEE